MTNVIVHDSRLAGSSGWSPDTSLVSTNASTPMSSIIADINNVYYAIPGLIDEIRIMCHGYAGYNTAAQMSGDFGGYGLQLGSDDLTLNNYQDWYGIAGTTNRIVVYSCAAADTQPENEGQIGDGMRLMGYLACVTGARVFAADRIQWYTGASSGSIDFGAWEGQLYRFDPDGSSRAVWSVN